jgi:hypothetical protein
MLTTYTKKPHTKILVRGYSNLHKINVRARSKAEHLIAKCPASYIYSQHKSYNRYSTITMRFVALCAPALTVYCTTPVAASSEDLTVMWL